MESLSSLITFQVSGADGVFLGAAGTLNGDGIFVTEEFIGFVFPSTEDGKDSFQGAAASKLESSSFQNLMRSVIGDCLQLLCAELGEPFFIEVWLRCDQRKVIS